MMRPSSSIPRAGDSDGGRTKRPRDKTSPAYARELAANAERRRRTRDPAAHAEAERVRYWTKRDLPVPAKGSILRAAKPKGAPVPLVPIPLFPAGHELYVEARAALKGYERSELDRDMDTGARDVLQTYVLAKLEGLDPLEAIRAFRSRLGKDRKVLIHGLALVDGLSR